MFLILTGVLCLLVIFFYLIGGRKAATGVQTFWGNAVMLFAGIKIEAEGLEELSKGPAVIMSNHASMIDIPILFAALPLNLRFVFKHSLAYVPVLGQVMLLIEHIPINRGNRKKSMQSLKRAGNLIRTGLHVLIFPEGTRSKSATLLPFKKGGFILAIQEKLPIVPISLSHSRTVCGRSSILTKPGLVKVKVHKAVDTSDYNLENRGKLLEKVRDIIDTGLERDPAERLL
jgi:1-acyl-sn-glycerol-3-phosphate acyltransferase